MPSVSPPVWGRPYALVEAAPGEQVIHLDGDALIARYKADGALLLRGFPLDLAAFRDFAGRFCTGSVFNESADRRMLDDAANIQSVNGGRDPFPLHPELSREPWKPDVCFFGCLRPPASGGWTTICDGAALVRHLPPEIRDGLAHRRLVYVQPAPPEVLARWLGTANPSDALLTDPPASCPYRFVRRDGRVLRLFSRPALHRPMFLDAPAFGNFLLFARFHNGNPAYPVLDDGNPVPERWLRTILAVGERLSVPVRWRAGDLLMLDNSRFMHGRTAITDPDERLIATYFGYLSFAVPDAEEPADAPWRRGAFRPPARRTAAYG